VERLLTLDPAGFAGAIVGIAAVGAVIASRRASRLRILERWSNDSVRTSRRSPLSQPEATRSVRALIRWWAVSRDRLGCVG